MAMADGLIHQAGGLRRLLSTCPRELSALAGIDPGLARQISCVKELFRRHLEERLERGNSLTSPAETLQYLQTVLRDRRREIFACLFLDTRHRVMACDELFQGLD